MRYSAIITDAFKPVVATAVNKMAAVIVAVTLLGTPAAADTAVPVVSVFGDSLSAGYRLARGEGVVPSLAAELEKRGIAATLINAAVSGETSGEGLLRLNWVLRKKPDLVIVELGANDMLRGFPPSLVEKNLDKIVGGIKQAGAKVLLAGMLASPNLGEQYGMEFAAVYQRLAVKHDVAFYPFFLKDVALVPTLNLDDGIHPNAAGARVIAANIAPLVAQLLTSE